MRTVVATADRDTNPPLKSSNSKHSVVCDLRPTPKIVAASPLLQDARVLRSIDPTTRDWNKQYLFTCKRSPLSPEGDPAATLKPLTRPPGRCVRAESYSGYGCRRRYCFDAPTESSLAALVRSREEVGRCIPQLWRNPLGAPLSPLKPTNPVKRPHGASRLQQTPPVVKTKNRNAGYVSEIRSKQAPSHLPAADPSFIARNQTPLVFADDMVDRTANTTGEKMAEGPPLIEEATPIESDITCPEHLLSDFLRRIGLK